MDVSKCWSDCLGGGNAADVAQIQCLECIILQVFHIVVRLAGVVVFIMLIIGGFRYLTAGGDPKSTESARKIITYAIFGLVLILAAWFLLNFIGEFTGISAITEFTFPKAP